MRTLSTIHLLLAQVRKERGIQQSVIADALNLDQTAISLYENGKRGIPLPTVERWCEILNIKIEITPQGYEPAKEPDCEQRDLEELSRLKRKRNYLIAEMRSMMAQRVMGDTLFQESDTESGEGRFWPYSFHADSDIGLIETRYDHPSQKYLAVVYESGGASVYRLDPALARGIVGRALMDEDSFLSIGGSISHDDLESLKAPIFRINAGNPDRVELVGPQGFSARTLVEIEENLGRFAAAYDEARSSERYVLMEDELLDIEGRMDDLRIDNRLGNGMPNPAFELWTEADEQAVSVPLYEAERTWRWVEEGAEWADGCASEISYRPWVDPEVHELCEAPNNKEPERHDGIIEPAQELDDPRNEKE